MKATTELNKIKGMDRVKFSSHIYFWEKFAPKNATHMSFTINGDTKIIWWDNVNNVAKWDDLNEWESFRGSISENAVKRPNIEYL